MYLPITAAVLLFLFCLGLFLRWRHRKNERKEDVREMRAWMVKYQSPNHAFQLWKYGLSLQESEVLMDLARGYCTSLNWDLEWLLSSQLEKAPVLESAVEIGVNNYLESVFVSLQTERDVQAYQVYQAFEKKPTARKNRAMVEQLYDRLSRDGLIPKAKRLLGRVTRRQVNLNQQAAAIEHAFDNNAEHTMELLKEVLAGGESSSVVTSQPQPIPQQVAVPPVLANAPTAEPAT